MQQRSKLSSLLLLLACCCFNNNIHAWVPTVQSKNNGSGSFSCRPSVSKQRCLKVYSIASIGGDEQTKNEEREKIASYNDLTAKTKQQSYSTMCSIDTRRLRGGLLAFNMIIAFFFTSNLLNPNVANAIPMISSTKHEQQQQGVSLITDSSIGKAVRKSTIQGARIMDNLDEKWERFSDSLRDEKKCDENTGRRLYDNGFRKDGTRVGNPVLGALCNPVVLGPFNQEFGSRVLYNGLNSAVGILDGNSMVGKDSTNDKEFNKRRLQNTIESVESLVQPSFERSIAKIDESNLDERQRQLYNFATYTNIKAINDVFISTSTSSSSSSSSFSTLSKQFYVSWGNTLSSYLAPNADRNNYSSPFPEMKDEFEDYDYDKNDLLDSLGILNVALKEMQRNGLIGYFEISVPYDDYGSVVTIAVDDDITLGSQVLLREQGSRMNGSYVEALVRSVMEKANVKYSYDSFFIDPSTTKQSVYNPTQLLISLSNLRIKD